MMPTSPLCPVCGQPATVSYTQYGVRHAHCGLWSWDGKPLVDASTHEARKDAHHAFDTLWRGPAKIVQRGHAYRLLREELGLSKEACHMAEMDVETARLVPAAAARIRAQVLAADRE